MSFFSSRRVVALVFSLAAPVVAHAADPDIDPAAFAVRLDLPSGVAMQPDGAVLTVGVKSGLFGKTSSVAFALEQQAGQGDYVLSAADRQQMQGLLAQAKAAEKAGKNIKGSVSLRFSPCRTQEVLAADAVASLAMRTTQEGGFETLARDVSIKRIAGVAVSDLPDCAS